MIINNSIKTLYQKLKYHIGNNGDAHALADDFNAGFISPDEKKTVAGAKNISNNGYNLLPLSTLRTLKDTLNGFNFGVWDPINLVGYNNSLSIVDDTTIFPVPKKIKFVCPTNTSRIYVYHDIPSGQKAYRDKVFELNRYYTISAYVTSPIDISVQLRLEGILDSELFTIKANTRTKISKTFLMDRFNTNSNDPNNLNRLTAGVEFKGVISGTVFYIDSLKVGYGGNNDSFNNSLYELDTLYGNKLYNIFDFKGDLYTLQPGNYEFSVATPSDAQNLPSFLSSESAFIFNVYVYEGSYGRKQFILNHSGTNDWYIGNTHTSGTTIKWFKTAQIYQGTGSPNGVVTERVGAMYFDTQNTALYFKSGIGDTNTGWIKITTTAS